MNKKVLVTGANGFVGSHVVRELCKQRQTVKAFVQEKTDLRNLQGLDVEICTGDLRDPGSLENALQGCHVVYHLAAYNQLWCSNPDLPLTVNVQGTQNLLGLARKENIEKFIYTGSATLFRRSNGRFASESDFLLVEPKRNPYERSKYLAELGAIHFQKFHP